jgi:hypothetical protein
LERAGIQFEASTQSYDKKKITLSTCASNRSYIPWSELYKQQSTPSTSYSQSSDSQSSDSLSSQYSGIRLFSPPSRNGRHMTFYRIPKSLSAEQSKKNFLRNVPQAVFETMLADAGGAVGEGVELFVERLFKIDAGAVVAGVRSGGGACFKRFDAAETVALQRLLGLFVSKRKQLAAILCKRNSGNSEIASDKEISNIKCAAAEARHLYGVYTYTHTPDKSTQEVQVDIRYRVTCPFQLIRRGKIQMERGEISERLKAAQDRCNEAKAHLRKVHGAPRTNWRVHNGVEKILSGYSIRPKKYHGGALTGGV